MKLQFYRFIIFFILTFPVNIQYGSLNALYSNEFKYAPGCLYNTNIASIPKDEAYYEKISEIQNSLDNIVKRYHLNGNILISIHNTVIYKNSLGYANLRTHDSLNINTLFQLASTSKPFTSMSIMILKERGLLDYDDLVVKHVPTFPYSNITIKQLLTHTSGLSNYIWNVEKYWQTPKPVTNEDVLKLYQRKKFPLIFRPGTKFSYCNTNYCFLATIVEKVSGIAFSDFLEQNIFIPLGMYNTLTYDKLKIRGGKDRAMGHTMYKRGGYRIYNEDIVDLVFGDKGVFSTVEDLYKWDQTLYSNKLVSYATINEAFEKGTLNNKNHINYGYGFRLKEVDNKKIVYHNGWWKGFKVGFSRLVEDKSTIIVLNNTNAHLGGMLDEIQKLIQNSF